MKRSVEARDVAWDHCPERLTVPDDSDTPSSDGTMVPSYGPVAWDHCPERPVFNRDGESQLVSDSTQRLTETA